MNGLYQEYEEASLSLKAINIQLNLRAKEGNDKEVKELLQKKKQAVEICDSLYCQTFLQKVG